MPERSRREPIPLAFALGGLGGNNLFGLGFLAAAVENKMRPRMISATSGQIHLIWLYQKARSGRLKDYQVDDLSQLAAVYAEKTEIKPRATVFYPAFPLEMWRGSLTHLLDYATLRKSGALPYAWNLVNNLPARVCEMDTTVQVLESMADDFNHEEKMGIAFNSYDPRSGTEYVYLNPIANELLGDKLGRRKGASTFRNSQHHAIEYRPIDCNAVRDALWLYEYGFEGHTMLDGCYIRQVMLHELAHANLIVSVRPLRSEWTAPLPEWWLDKEDLKTKVFFNAAYAGERFRIEFINRLCESHDPTTKRFVKEQGYHPVKFVELEPEHDWTFASLFAEEMEMFKDGHDALVKKIREGEFPPAAFERAKEPEPQPELAPA